MTVHYSTVKAWIYEQARAFLKTLPQRPRLITSVEVREIDYRMSQVASFLEEARLDIVTSAALAAHAAPQYVLKWEALKEQKFDNGTMYYDPGRRASAWILRQYSPRQRDTLRRAAEAEMLAEEEREAVRAQSPAQSRKVDARRTDDLEDRLGPKFSWKK